MVKDGECFMEKSSARNGLVIARDLGGQGICHKCRQ